MNTMATDKAAAPAQPIVVSRLTRQERWNIGCLVLAFSCVVAFLTLVVGTGAVVIKSVGGDTTLAPFPLGVFFLGMGMISLTATPWIFALWGRKYGFWAGCAIALVGVVIGILGCTKSSPGLILFANLFLGAGAGISMYVRFAAVEVVPPDYASRSVSWVLCGGCLAAFAGPEAATATAGAFGDDHMKYLGVFVVAGAFCVAQAIFVGLVTFPSAASKGQEKEESSQIKPTEEGTPQDDNVNNEDTSLVKETPENYSQGGEEEEDVEQPAQLGPRKPNRDSIASTPDKLGDIIRRPDFIVPVIVSALSWAIMAMPMSIFRITMRDLGYTDRQSLTVIEFHFLSMYFPGFFSGAFIKKYGVVRASQLSAALFLMAFCFNMTAMDRNDALWSWYLGLISVGFGWNFGFTSATVWVTKSYLGAPHLKAKVQAVNECLVFFISGSLIFSTGFIYDDAGGGGIRGWRLLNFVLLGLMLVDLATILGFQRFGTPTQPQQETPKQIDGSSHSEGKQDVADTELVEMN